MKKKTFHLFTTAVLSCAYLFFGAACTEEEHSDHDGHDHGEEHHEGDGHDHGEDEHHEGDGHDHSNEKEASHEGHDHDHEHGEIVAGPNGGRVLEAVEPHLEFFVTEDRKVEIIAVDDEEKAIPLGDQVVTVIGGDRSSPTRMKFEKQGDKLVSDTAFPEGNDFPVVVQVKKSPDAKSETIRFNLNLEDCPTCDYQEYACVCDHEH